MVESDIVVFLLAIVGMVSVLIIFYYILICISSSRINKTISTVQRIRARQQQQQSAGTTSGTTPGSNIGQDQIRRTLTRSIQSNNLPRADANTYILGPTATADESQRDFRSGRPHTSQRPGHVRMGSTDSSSMRFYTAEELVNFPFDEHIEELRRQIEEEEETRRNSVAAMNACMHPIDYNSRRVTIATMNHGQHQVRSTDADSLDGIVLSPNHAFGPPVVLRGPEIVIDTEERIAIDRIRTRQSRARLCYSIPASYIGRPPAYLANDEDPPPNYHDAIKLSQIKEEESNERDDVTESS